VSFRFTDSGTLQNLRANYVLLLSAIFWPNYPVVDNHLPYARNAVISVDIHCGTRNFYVKVSSDNPHYEVSAMTDHTTQRNLYTLKLNGPGIDLDKEITEETLNKVMGVLFESPRDPHSRQLESTQVPHAATQEDMTLREFINDVEPSTKPRMITTIAYYLFEHEGKSHFRKEDIKERFAEAKEQMPANFDRDLSAAMKHGWLTEDRNNPKTYYITRTGIKSVREKFPSAKK
jgi:hypothetical protein